MIYFWKKIEIELKIEQENSQSDIQIKIQYPLRQINQAAINMQLEKLPKLNKQASNHPVSFSDNNQTDNIPSFLLKTYEILESGKYNDIISWTRNGEGFIVRKVKQFSETVLPVYFRHNNYTSFVRQLNMYDFHKTRQENQQNAFKNFLFKKGQKYLLKQIQRKDYKKNKETNKEIYSILQKQKILQPNQTQPPTKAKQETILQTPQNECFRTNINQLIKSKSELQEKSLKLMGFKQTELNAQMLMKAIDVLFQCQFAVKKAFCQTQILKVDYELNQRKKYITSFEENVKDDDQKQQIFTAERIQTKDSLNGFKDPWTETKTVLFPTAEPKQSALTGFQKFEMPYSCLLNSFKSC